jgi:hypothetical protein
MTAEQRREVWDRLEQIRLVAVRALGDKPASSLSSEMQTIKVAADSALSILVHALADAIRRDRAKPVEPTEGWWRQHAPDCRMRTHGYGERCTCGLFSGPDALRMTLDDPAPRYHRGHARLLKSLRERRRNQVVALLSTADREDRRVAAAKFEALADATELIFEGLEAEDAEERDERRRISQKIQEALYNPQVAGPKR